MDKNEYTYEVISQLRAFVDSGQVALVLLGLADNEFQEQDRASGFESITRLAYELHVTPPFERAGAFEQVQQMFTHINIEQINWEYVIMYDVGANSHQMTIAEGLVKRLEGVLQTPRERVLVAEGEKFTPFLLQLVEGHINSDFVITTNSALYKRILEMIFIEHRDTVEIVLSDIYRYQFLNQKFDAILSVPRFGGRELVDYEKFMCRESDLAAFENLLLHLNVDGEMAIVLPARVTFAIGRVKDLREFVQDNYTLTQITELPQGIFSFTGIKTLIIRVVSHRPSDDNEIVITKCEAEERKSLRDPITELKDADETFVMLEELKEKGDWNIEHIFAQQDEEWLHFKNSDVRKERLGEVATVFRGKNVSRKDDTGNIGVVNIGNIGEYEIDYAGLDHVELDERKATAYILQDGDVLIPARGTAIRTAVYREQKDICIASSNVIVIRPDASMLNSIYLKIFFDSPLGKKIIRGAQQGMTVISISYKDLAALEIPLPSLEAQNSIVAQYQEEFARYKKAISDAEDRWNDVLKKLQKF